MTAERQLSLLKGPRQRGVTRKDLASEFQLHCAIAGMLRLSLKKDWWYSHIGHGEERTAMAGARLKRCGLKPGIYDLLFFDPEGRAYFLELKRCNGVVSATQDTFAIEMQSRGISCKVAYGYDEAVAILREWGAVKVRL